MRKRVILLIACLAVLVAPSLSLWAQVREFGKPKMSTVSAAKEAVDDSWIVLEGHIIRQVGGDKYLFRDATGKIVVEIDHEDWKDVTANPETPLRISGEIDREWWSTKVDVETVEAVSSRSHGNREFK